MTIYQEAHKRIDEFPEDIVYLIIQPLDKMETKSGLENKVNSKSKFLATAGKIDIDEMEVNKLREVSML